MTESGEQVPWRLDTHRGRKADLSGALLASLLAPSLTLSVAARYSLGRFALPGIASSLVDVGRALAEFVASLSQMLPAVFAVGVHNTGLHFAPGRKGTAELPSAGR